MLNALRLLPALAITVVVFGATAALAAVPPPPTPPGIAGAPTIVTPDDLLDWPDDVPEELPNLTEPTSNRLADFHGDFSDCDIVLSTAGNYHMALKELWQLYLHTYVDDLDIRNWFYTTSPPVGPAHVASGVVQFGKLMGSCRPQVVVGPQDIMNALPASVKVGTPVKIISNYGNVILVKKGNPKKVSSVWDLGRHNVTVITPNQTV